MKFQKDPVALLDYSVDWSQWLAADTISTSNWTVPTGLTQVTSTNTATKTTVWLSGGTLGTVYTIKNIVTTSGGRTDERSFDVELVQK